jgi:MFS family permease
MTISHSDTRSQTGQNVLLVVAVLGVINLVSQMDRVLFSLMVEPIKAELGLSDGQMGLLGGLAFALCFAFMGLAAGRIADRWNRVSLIGIALCAWSAATAACGLATNFVQMFVVRMLVGTSEAGCVPSAQSLIADASPPHRRALWLSVFTGIGTVGTLVGLVLGGVVMEMIGWRMTFVAFGAFGLIPLAILMLTLKDTRSLGAGTAMTAPWTQDVHTMLCRREIQVLLVALPLLYTTVGAATWIPAFFDRAYGVSAQDFSRTGGAFLGFGLILGTFAGGFVVNRLMGKDHRWEFWWSAISASLSLVPLMTVYFGSNLNLAYGALFAAFFIAGTGFGPSMASMHSIAGQSVRATAVALMMFVTSLVAYGGVPAAIGFLSDMFAANGASVSDGTSLRLALVASALLTPVSSILFVVSARIAFPGPKLGGLSHQI